MAEKMVFNGVQFSPKTRVQILWSKILNKAKEENTLVFSFLIHAYPMIVSREHIKLGYTEKSRWLQETANKEYTFAGKDIRKFLEDVINFHGSFEAILLDELDLLIVELELATQNQKEIGLELARNKNEKIEGQKRIEEVNRKKEQHWIIENKLVYDPFGTGFINK